MVGEFIKRWTQWSDDDVGQTKNTVVLPVSLIMLRRDFCFAPGTTSTLSCSSHCEGLNFVTTALLFTFFFFFALAACNYARHWADSSDSHHWAKDGATWSDWASLGKHSLWQTPTVMYKNGYTWLNVTLNRTPVKPAKIKPTATKMSVHIQKKLQ